MEQCVTSCFATATHGLRTEVVFKSTGGHTSQATFISRQMLDISGKPAPKLPLVVYCLETWQVVFLILSFPFCYDVYLACRWANWKRHHALSFHHVVILGKNQERQGNHFKYPPSALSPEIKQNETKQKPPLIQIYGLHILTFRSLWTMPFRWQWFTLSRICCIQWL